MIVIDPRAGSINLPKLFPADMVTVTQLPACDLLLTSQDGGEFWTGIEHKMVNDVLQCITNGRFAGTQLPAMAELVGDYWLVIEGPFKKGPGGELMTPGHGRDQWWQARVGNRYFDYDDLDKWIITMQTLTPLKIKVSQGRLETRDWVMLLHNWWEHKDRHRSHMVTDKSKSTVELVRASLLRRIAEQLPGIGHDKAIRVEQHFGDVFEMVVADRNEWQRIEGVGPKMAERIVEAINGRE